MPNIHAIGGGCDDGCCGCGKIYYLPDSSYWTQVSGSWTFSGAFAYTASISGPGVAYITDWNQGFDGSRPDDKCLHAGIPGPWKCYLTMSTLTDGDKFGVVFGLQDDDNYWWVEYHYVAAGSDTMYVKRKVAGVDETLYTYSSSTLVYPRVITYYPGNQYTEPRLRFEWSFSGDTAVPDYVLAEEIPWGLVGIMVAATSGTVTFTGWSWSSVTGASNTHTTACVTREVCTVCRESPAPVEVDVAWDDVANDTGCSAGDCANLGNFAVTAKRRSSLSTVSECDWYGTFGTYGTCRVRIFNAKTNYAYWDEAIVTNGIEGGNLANLLDSDDTYHTVQADADGIIDVEYRATIDVTDWSERNRSLVLEYERRLHKDVEGSQFITFYLWNDCTDNWQAFGCGGSQFINAIQGSTSANDGSVSCTIPAGLRRNVMRFRIYGTGLDAGTIWYVDRARVAYSPKVAARIEVLLGFANGFRAEACSAEMFFKNGSILFRRDFTDEAPQCVGHIATMTADDIVLFNDWNGICDWSNTTITVTGVQLEQT